MHSSGPERKIRVVKRVVTLVDQTLQRSGAPLIPAKVRPLLRVELGLLVPGPTQWGQTGGQTEIPVFKLPA